jgi:tetratricopeptide (TPR) repeat protein
MWGNSKPVQSQGIEELLREGIAAAQAGQKEKARELLLQVIAQDEEIEAAWLWLSGVVDGPEEKEICLENVLALDPGNRAARNGLRRLREPDPVSMPEPGPIPPPQAEAAQQPIDAAGPETRRVEIDPFGCPYCGGPVGGEASRCDHCGRSVELRLHRRSGGAGVVRLAIFIFLLGLATWLEGHLVSEVMSAEPFPEWVSQTALHLAFGPASFNPESITYDLANLTALLTVVHNGLAVLCVVAAAGLALRSRVAYISSFALAGLLVATSLAGLLTGLTGWLPTFLLAGLVAITVKWLADSAIAFEWQTRHYDASLDRHLREGVDFYHRGQRYGGMGMWAKAAAHWQVATQLEPGRAQYHLALARAYAEMDYPDAAVAETDKALAVAPGDRKAQTFRDSLTSLPEA